MRLRYRILTREFDAEGFADLRRRTRKSRWKAEPDQWDFVLGRRGPEDRIGQVNERTSMPSKVHADEGEASLSDLQELVRAGDLKPDDLVFEGGVWTCVRDSAALHEVFDETHRPGANVGMIVGVGVAACVGLFLAWLFA